MIVTLIVSEMVPHTDRIIDAQSQFRLEQLTQHGPNFIYGEVMKLRDRVNAEVKEATGPVQFRDKTGKLFVRRK